MSNSSTKKMKHLWKFDTLVTFALGSVFFSKGLMLFLSPAMATTPLIIGLGIAFVAIVLTKLLLVIHQAFTNKADHFMKFSMAVSMLSLAVFLFSSVVGLGIAIPATIMNVIGLVGLSLFVTSMLLTVIQLAFRVPDQSDRQKYFRRASAVAATAIIVGLLVFNLNTFPMLMVIAPTAMALKIMLGVVLTFACLATTNVFQGFFASANKKTATPTLSQRLMTPILMVASLLVGLTLPFTLPAAVYASSTMVLIMTSVVICVAFLFMGILPNMTKADLRSYQEVSRSELTKERRTLSDELKLQPVRAERFVSCDASNLRTTRDVRSNSDFAQSSQILGDCLPFEDGSALINAGRDFGEEQNGPFLEHPNSGPSFFSALTSCIR